MNSRWARPIGGMGRCDKCNGLSYFFDLRGALVCSECHEPEFRSHLRRQLGRVRRAMGKLRAALTQEKNDG